MREGTVEIPSEDVGLFVGKAGANISMIKSLPGVIAVRVEDAEEGAEMTPVKVGTMNGACC